MAELMRTASPTLAESMDGMARTFSGGLARAAGDLRETYFCYVCQSMLEVGPESLLLCCGHHVHRECWEMQLEYHINNNQGRQPVCNRPAIKNAEFNTETREYEGGTCNVPLTDDEIREIVSPGVFEKLVRLREQNADPTMRTCERCDTIQPGSPDQKKIVCINETCQHVFCYEHGDACQAPREGVPEDASFEERCDSFGEVDENYKVDVAYLQKEVEEGRIRHCPHCEAPVQKNSGCNAMTCAQCKQGFCWLCGDKIIDAEGFPPHFSSWNTNSQCAGKQFEGYDGEMAGGAPWNGCERSVLCLVIFACLAVMTPFMIFFFIGLICSLIALVCFVQCFGPLCNWRPLQDREEGEPQDKCLLCLVYALMVGLTLVLILPPMLVLAPLWCPMMTYARCKNQAWAREQARTNAEEATAAADRAYEAQGEQTTGNTTATEPEGATALESFAAMESGELRLMEEPVG